MTAEELRNDTDERGMKEVYVEYSRAYGVAIRVRMPREYNIDVDYDYLYDAAQMVLQGMRRETAKLDAETEIGIKNTEDDFRKMFESGGFPVVYLERMPNQYWPESYADLKVKQPWFTITTPIGHFVIGWRKNVISIDWKRTVLGELFDLNSRKSITHGPGYCHAQSYTDGASVIAEIKAHLKT